MTLVEMATKTDPYKFTNQDFSTAAVAYGGELKPALPESTPTWLDDLVRVPAPPSRLRRTVIT